MTRFAILVGCWTVKSIEADTEWTSYSINILGAVQHPVSRDVASEAGESVETGETAGMTIVAFLAAAIIPKHDHAGTESSCCIGYPGNRAIA